MLLRGGRGLAQAYERGLWECSDLVALVRIAARNARRIDRARRSLLALRAPISMTRSLLHPSTRSRREQEIAAHYDLGEDLFERMLDATMSYSCGVFEDGCASLEEAQLAKLELVCEKLQLTSSDRVIEVGTGWGGFAIHAATSRGCHVTTTTISRRQYRYVLERVRSAGVSQRVRVLCVDYADLKGHYDKLVSIEMIEAVGWRNIRAFLSTCSKLLRPDGAMLLQAITIDDRLYELERDSRTFINTHIFPGGCLPSLEAIVSACARGTDVQLLDVEDLTADYVRTLSQWRSRFGAALGDLEQRGYSDRFLRRWELYLAWCEAGFAERRICDYQILMGKPACSLIPAGIRASRARARQLARA